MARWWKENYDAARHRNEMRGEIDDEYQFDVDLTAHDNLLRQHVILVEVAQFNFTFLSLRQLEVCLSYFEQKVRPSSRIVGGIGAADHWEVLRWYDRLPPGLISEHKRPKIVKALRAALDQFRNHADYAATRQ